MRPLSLSPVLASLATVFKIPLSQTTLRPAISHLQNISLNQPSNPVTRTAPFSTTAPLEKRRGKHGPGVDRRITLIRYFLNHPKTPRPLRFSRTRYLRHWTIHRAWHLYQAQRRRAHQVELERQWQAMRSACEELRVGAGDGGRLFRKSMIKTRIFQDMFPIEYARLQTEGPAEEGWNHEWRRVEGGNKGRARK